MSLKEQRRETWLWARTRRSVEILLIGTAVLMVGREWAGAERPGPIPKPGDLAAPRSLAQVGIPPRCDACLDSRGQSADT